MITIDKVTYRNLQEQVQKNKEDIAAWQNVGFTLNSFGIKVLGKVDSESDIPTGTYEYGDAYLVGLTDPYDLYIYTRTNEAADSGSFVNVGPLNVIGQEGPEGPQGPAGVDGYSPVVRYGNGLPIVESTDKDGYLYIDQQTSRLYTFKDNKWNYVVNMQGAKGDQGNQGIQGATGITLSIVARLASPDLLPTNFATGAIPKNSAYLVDVQGANHLYIILGDQSDYSTWYWADAGDFNLGSVLYKDSAFQQYANITDSYNTNTGAVVTDTATSKLASDITSELNTKVSIETFDNEILNKADIDQVVSNDTFNSTIAAINAKLDNIYPVGSIYMSVNSTNPSTLFGGTWEQIKDRFLLSAGDIYANGSTGGEATHTLTIAEMPKHTHLQSGGASGVNDDGNVVQRGYSSPLRPTADVGETGDNQPHNNMPPYLAVYMWKRTS